MSNYPLHASGVSAAAANPTALQGGQPAVIPANVQAGPISSKIDTQTALQQIAARVFVESQEIDVPLDGSKVGPLSGLTPGLKVQTGESSQTAVTQQDMRRAVYNALRRGAGLETKQFDLASSERYFWITCERTFNTDGDHLMSIDKSPTSEMAKALSIASGGILSTNDLIEGINSGEIGYTTNRSIVGNSRMESAGLKRINRRS